jgi:hypothetical protein
MATFRITLRTNDDDDTAVRHLRAALKTLRRKYRLQCTHIAEGIKQNAHEYGAAELVRVLLSAAEPMKKGQ